MTDNTSPVLRTVRLGKRYGKRQAVDALDLEVQRGEIFGFLGPNGAGKSTSIRMMLSLIRPSAGHVELFGRRMLSHRSETLQRVGGLVERADFYLYLSARRNLEIVAALYGKVDRHAVDDALGLVGLTDRAGDRVKTFSHGMKQRLGLAQALLSHPELIILDEPTTGLDPQGIVEVRTLITTLARERGITVFLSSHLLSEIEQTATSMAIIHHGTLRVQGKVAELLTADEAVVRIDARPLETARAVFSTSHHASKVVEEDGHLLATMPVDRIPDLVRVLVEHGALVHSVEPRRSLEEYFLRMTADAETTAR